MADDTERMYNLIDDLGALLDDGISIFPGRLMVSAKELARIYDAFPDAITAEINDARVILKKKDEILQEAKLRAERIIQDAQAEKYKLLNESNLHRAMEEEAKKFRQTVYDECQQIKMAAFNEAQELRLNAKNESLRMREGSQDYAQQLLNKLQQDLDSLYQDVMNSQQRLQQLKNAELAKQQVQEQR